MGIKVKKEWIATLDGRTRHSHGIADGQQVEIDGKFKVGASELRFPGDPQGAAEEVYNCRCTMATVEPPEILRGEEPRRTYQEWYKSKENAENVLKSGGNGGIIKENNNITEYKKLLEKEADIDQKKNDLDIKLLELENKYYDKYGDDYDNWDEKIKKEYNRAGDAIRSKIDALDVKAQSIIQRKSEAEIKAVRALAENLKEIGGFDKVNIDGCDFDSAEMICSAFKVNFERIPKLKGTIGEFRLEKIDDLNDYGYTATLVSGSMYLDGYTYKTSRIVLNKHLYSDVNNSGILEKLKRNVDTGWHPQGCDNAYSTISHEFGHAIENYQKNNKLPMLYGTNRKKLLESIGIYVKNPQTDNVIADGLSKYAIDAKNGSEFVPEAWSEYICSPNPRPIAKAVGEYIINQLK